EVLYRGRNILDLSPREMREMRRKMQIVFQDPYSSLNPRMSVKSLIEESLRQRSCGMNSAEREQKVLGIMDLVGLERRLANSYPHELDGGRRQRIGIARALILEPEFVVLDEPVSALDVCVQAQILNLLMDLQKELKLTYLFISHNLSVVKHISDQIAVMYLGQCVELAPTKTLFSDPLHPYTHGLLNAIPIPSLKHRKALHIMKGEVVSPIDPKPGCRFAARCPEATDECRREGQTLREVAPGHFVSCFKR
ncbi:MAG: ATP-binding cassette domain-containing protein, partial [Pyramidobacter sp.]|nr:ATP-binding cassette domain-containing protein [Pyramidobacter sp.]